MTQRSRNKQSGIALLMLVVLLVMAGGYGFYRVANTKFSQNSQRESILLRLNEAKEALIAYAAIDDNRPGRLVCPDTIGSGDADWSFSRNDCDKYADWIPGKTLRLASYADETGLNFRYQLSPLFGGNPTTTINSETETTLRLDVAEDSPSNDIAALIIATRGDIDPRNADGDNYFYNGSGNGPLDNDLIVAVTRSELMATTETRIANELRLCLEKHSIDSENTEKTYPWPAPLTNDIFKGVSGSKFGMVPETQPGNPDEALRQTINNLKQSKTGLDLALTAGDLTAQRAAILEIQEIAAYARAQFDRLFIVASALKKAADEAAEDEFCKTPSPQPNFKTLSSLFSLGTKNGTSFTKSVSGFAETTQNTLPTFAPLLEALVNSGFDLFTTELQIQNDTLILKRTAAANLTDEKTLTSLLSQINSIRNGVLEYSLSSNSTINSQLIAAGDAAVKARDDTLAAKKEPGNVDKSDLALKSADALVTANTKLLTTIKALTFPPGSIDRTGEIIIASNRLTDQTIRLSTNLTETERSNLAFQIEDARALVGSIQPDSDLLPLQENATQQLGIGLDTLNNQGATRVGITATVINASNAMFSFANAIQPSPAREALIAFKTNLDKSIGVPPTTLLAAQDLHDQIQGILYWSKIASSQANDIARLSRKGVCSKDDSTSSAYTDAKKLLDSIDGETGSLAAIDKPSAKTAGKVAETSKLLNILIDKTTTLEQLLEAPHAAAAVPTVWHGKECDFLKPPTSEARWWNKEKWGKYFVYQITDRINPAPDAGQLKVSGRGQYRVVVLSAGAPLAGQDRSKRETKEFLEGNNQHSSRNGLAFSPTVDFYEVARSRIFNDRVAYCVPHPNAKPSPC